MVRFEQHHMDMAGPDGPDDLELDLAERLKDPQFAAGFEDAASRVGLLKACLAGRKSADLTQAEVARLMETTQSAISELESGGTDPRLSTLQRYARAIGCRLDLQLCSGDPASGWRRLGTDVHYSSHEHRIPIWGQGAARKTLTWNPQRVHWTKQVEVKPPNRSADPWAENAVAQ